MTKESGGWDFIKAIGLFFVAKFGVEAFLRVLGKGEESMKTRGKKGGDSDDEPKPKFRVVK